MSYNIETDLAQGDTLIQLTLISAVTDSFSLGNALKCLCTSLDGIKKTALQGNNRVE